MVDPERNLLALRGAVPGAKNGLVLIRRRAKPGAQEGAQVEPGLASNDPMRSDGNASAGI
jgi:hypothetical protein